MPDKYKMEKNYTGKNKSSKQTTNKQNWVVRGLLHDIKIVCNNYKSIVWSGIKKMREFECVLKSNLLLLELTEKTYNVFIFKDPAQPQQDEDVQFRLLELHVVQPEKNLGDDGGKDAWSKYPCRVFTHTGMLSELQVLGWRFKTSQVRFLFRV